ncbi:MAG: LemA family protein [Desulfobacteraceae bacterium]|nr:MAG: LemA family protein [Desulfobacteraceae bacterium]
MMIIVAGMFAVMLFFLGLTGLFAVVTYNSVVKSDNRVDGSWAQVETALQRRIDLIPNLVSTVKGYAAHEKDIFIAVTQARTQAQSVLDKIKETGPDPETMTSAAMAQGLLRNSFKSLLAVVENYPDLKASTNFLALQDQLEGTENRITVARGRYNESVRIYNAKIQAFPGNVISSLFGFNEHAYFKASDDAFTVPKVDFGS